MLVGPGTSDDAAIYRVSDELARIQTVDFFTPVVDDPCQFGASGELTADPEGRIEVVP